MFFKVTIGVLVLIHLFYLIALIKRNFAVMDIAWGLGFILISLISYMHYPLSFKNAILMTVVSLWGARLAIYIYSRSRGQPEDPRYNKYRKEWGKTANLQAYLKVFLFQGFLMLVVSLPITFGMRLESSSITLINWLGLILWMSGFTLEVYADAYMSWYRKQPRHKGQLCTSGPWKICRFPNYLGEISLWYGVYFLAFAPSLWWTIIGPLAINLLILKVTGVPLLEERYKKRPGYEGYAARVPRLLPFKL
jgi:steroid 5-alpha reductase family enzyme